jgi:hypothetical protein
MKIVISKIIYNKWKYNSSNKRIKCNLHLDREYNNKLIMKRLVKWNIDKKII